MDHEFSARGRIKSFGHAIRGLRLFVASTHNAWIHIVVFLLVIVFGALFEITKTEWLLVLLAAGFVLASEAVNTAIEIHMDLTSPEHHPFARDTKDVAAGAVLIAAIIAAIIGIVIFGPHIAAFF